MRISPAALRILEEYDWPGNIRELANVMERAAILVPAGVILPEHLPEGIRTRKSGEQASIQKKSGEPPVANIEEAERRAIREALRRTDGNRQAAAELLGISRRTLFYRLKQYGGEP